MIEEALIQYGVLGLWTISLLVQQYKNQKDTTLIIENNTKALIRVYEVIHKCPGSNKLKGGLTK